MANIKSINGNPIVVGASGIEDNAVTAAKIADGAVTLAKLGSDVEFTPPDGSVTTPKLADGAVTDAKLAQSGGVLEKVDDLESTKAPVIINTSSGAIASFDDGADDMPIKKLVANIEPVQDLHGYDSPWPAGGGKNKIVPLDKSSTIYSVSVVCSNSAETISVAGTATDNGGRSMKLTPDVVLPAGTYFLSTIAISGTVQATYVLNKSDDDSIIGYGRITLSEETAVYLGINVLKDTVYNEVVHIQLEADSTATAWTPYSNICPISGWTGAEIERTGKNLFEFGDGNVVAPYRIIPFPLGAKQKVYMSLHDKDTSVDVSNVSMGFVTTSFVANSALKNSQFRWVYQNNQPYTNMSNTSGGVSSADESNLLDGVLIYPSDETTLAKIQQRFDIQITVESTATDYEPYTGNQISVTFPSEAGTVYGGTLDVTNGKLTVDRAYTDLSGTTWIKSLFDCRYTSGIFENMKYTSATANDIICSAYEPSTASWGKYNGPCICINDQHLVLADDRFVDDASGLKAWMTSMTAAGTPVIAVYPLATPIEYQLTQQEVTTLLGTNSIWADTGDVEVTYPVDTKLYIDNKITQAIANALNS